MMDHVVSRPILVTLTPNPVPMTAAIRAADHRGPARIPVVAGNADQAKLHLEQRRARQTSVRLVSNAIQV